MTPAPRTFKRPINVSVSQRARELFGEHQIELHRRTVLSFAGVMGFQWIAAIAVAVWVSPLPANGGSNRTQVDAWTAVLIGGAICHILLVVWGLRSSREMRQIAEITAALEHEVKTRQQAESAASMTAAVGLAMTHGTELRAMLQQCADALVQHLGGGFARIWTIDERGEALHLQAGAGSCVALDAQFGSVPLGAHCVGAIAETRTAVLIPAADADLSFGDAEWIGREELVSFAGYPVQLDDRLLGVMVVLVREEMAVPALDALAAIADAIALGISRMRLQRDLAGIARDLESAETAQRKHTEQLDTMLDQLRLAERQAEAATRAKSDFLASMGHELRTPLNAIILYSALLLEHPPIKAEPASATDVERIQSASKQLLEMIDGILDLSKIETGKMTLALEQFNVRTLVREVADTVQPLVQNNGNTLTVRCTDEVESMYADAVKTRQILLNLLGNAAKFTTNGSITLDVTRDVIGSVPALSFSVCDTGIGMTHEQTCKVFEAFTQAETTGKYRGTGVGLAIVSGFCQLMGGDVSVQSAPDLGSRFIVRLPMKVFDLVPHPAGPAGESARNPRPMRGGVYAA